MCIRDRNSYLAILFILQDFHRESLLFTDVVQVPPADPGNALRNGADAPRPKMCIRDSYRYIVTNGLLEMAREIVVNAVKGNAVYLHKDLSQGDFDLRHRYLKMAEVTAEDVYKRQLQHRRPIGRIRLLGKDLQRRYRLGCSGLPGAGETLSLIHI